jgi:transcriptional regulator with XRE-family HTH domain
MVLLRRALGDVLRELRQEQGRTLRQVSAEARVSLGYLSEVERGQKEASSELLESICHAFDVPMSELLREVSASLAVDEQLEALAEPVLLTAAAPAGSGSPAPVPSGPMPATNLAA